MKSYEDVIKGLQCLITNDIECSTCPYAVDKFCPELVAKDAMELLERQHRIIKMYQKADSFLATHGWRWGD